jgi:CubicO group peptidase (beta-lactamase class C family)
VSLGLLINVPGRGVVVGQESKLVEKAEEYLKKVTSESTSGVAMLVARDGKVLLQTAGGMADIEQKIPATADTKFRIGSVSKQFTAMAVCRLAEQGKLSLQDPLSKYYPRFPNAQSITLEHLLTHTSGLHSYTDKPDFLGRVTEVAEPAAIIQSFEKDKPEFNPGEKFKYCNSGYFLLGEIVAKVSGKSFAEYLESEFFKPLDMNQTGIFVNSKARQDMARGYSKDGDKYELALDWDMSWAGGAGAMYSTVGDLHRWNEALYAGKIVSAESLKAATTPFKLPVGVNASNYGYGLSIAKYRRIPIISHSGGLNGWSSDLAYFPDQKCTVVVLTNALPGSPELTPQLIARKLADTALEDAIKAMPAPQVDTTIDPKSYAEYVGKYDYQGAVMEVTVVDNKIYAQLTGQEALEIFPMGKDEFFWKVVEAEVAFQRDEKGEIKAAQHTQNGGTFSAPKIVIDVALSEAQLEAFVGRYRYGIAMMTCTREGSQLYAQLTGQPKLPIFPVNETTFKWKVVEAQVEFIKDEAGKVVTARHTQGGTTFDAPRIKGRTKR